LSERRGTIERGTIERSGEGQDENKKRERETLFNPKRELPKKGRKKVIATHRVQSRVC